MKKECQATVLLNETKYIADKVNKHRWTVRLIGPNGGRFWRNLDRVIILWPHEIFTMFDNEVTK